MYVVVGKEREREERENACCRKSRTSHIGAKVLFEVAIKF